MQYNSYSTLQFDFTTVVNSIAFKNQHRTTTVLHSAMPKKQPKNAFFYYMLDVKRREEQCGQRFPGGLAQVSTLASAQWTVIALIVRQAQNTDITTYRIALLYSPKHKYTHRKWPRTSAASTRSGRNGRPIQPAPMVNCTPARVSPTRQ